MSRAVRWRRRLLALLALLLVLAAGAVLLLPRYARPLLEHVASGALGIPVAIGALDWQPSEDRLTVEALVLGDADAQVTVRRLVVDASPRKLWAGDIDIGRLGIEAPAGTLELDAGYRPRLPGFGDDQLVDRLVPPVTIGALVVTDADLTIRYPVQGELRAARLAVTQLSATDLGNTPGPPMRAALRGSLDGAPLEADATVQLVADAPPTITASGRVAGLEVNRRTVDLLPALQTFNAIVDLEAAWDSAQAPPLRLDVTLREPRITDDAGTEFAAQRIELPEVRIDVADGAIALDRLAVDHPVGTVQLDAQYRPIIGRFGRESRSGDDEPTELRLRQVEVTNAELTLRYPVAGDQRLAPLRLARLVATDLEVADEQVALQLEFDGALDGAPIAGNGRLQLGGAAPSAEGTLRVERLRVDRTRLDLPSGLESARGVVDAQAAFTYRSAPPQQELRLDLRLREPRLAGGDGTAFAATALALPAARIDFAQRQAALGPVSLDAPAIDVVMTERGILLPGLPPDSGAAVAPARGGGGPAAPWSVATGEIAIQGGRLRVRRDDAILTLGALSGRWGGLVAGSPQPLTLRAAIDGGGTLAVDGSLGLEPPDAQLDIEASALPLPVLAAVTQALPLQLTRGSGDATLALTQRDGALRVQGRGRLRDTHTAPPDAARPAEVMAVHEADAAITFERGARTTLDIDSLTLRYPYVLVQRHAGGTFPSDLLRGGGDATAPVAVRLGTMAVEGGKLEFLDTTLAPPYWTSLGSLRGEARDVGLPPTGDGAGRFSLSGKQDEISAIEISGEVRRDGIVSRATLRDAPLPAMNPYVGPLLGYDVTAGWLSLDIDAEPAPPGYAATARMKLRGVDVLQTGVDAIQQQSGVPLPVALSLIADHAGRIDMTLPLAIDVEAGRVTLGSVVGQAIRNAIVAALTSPLRILGSLFGTRGAPHAFAIDPIPFPPGAGMLAADGVARVGEIARILQAHSGLLLVATPQLTAADLAAVGAGEAPALAAARLAAVRRAFSGDDAEPRLAASRLMLVDWRPDTGTPEGVPGVYVELQDQP